MYCSYLRKMTAKMQEFYISFEKLRGGGRWSRQNIHRLVLMRASIPVGLRR